MELGRPRRILSSQTYIQRLPTKSKFLKTYVPKLSGWVVAAGPVDVNKNLLHSLHNILVFSFCVLQKQRNGFKRQNLKLKALDSFILFVLTRMIWKSISCNPRMFLHLVNMNKFRIKIFINDLILTATK